MMLDQNDLDRERTHAAWLRTSLAFIVAAIAMKHYATDGSITQTILLSVCGFFCAVQALILSPNFAARLISASLISVIVTVPFTNF